MKTRIALSLVLLASACATAPEPSAPTRGPTIEVTTSRATYGPGDEIEVRARIHNGTARPLTVARFRWDGGLTAGCWFNFEREGEGVIPVERAPLPQVMVSPHVGPERFETIAPGESATIRTVAFAKSWDLAGKSSSLKASYRDARTVGLEPGVHRVKVRYDFNPDEPLPAEYRGCFEGTLEAEARFEVVAR